MKSADIANLWYRLPYVLPIAVLTWAALLWGFGLLLKNMAEDEHSHEPMIAEIMEVHSPEKHLPVQSPPKPKPVRKNTPPQLLAPTQQLPAQTPVLQTPPSSSTPAVALPATNMASGKQSIPYNAPSSVKSIANSVQGSGDSITPPQFGIAYLNNPKPYYPAFARRMGIQGTVMLKVLVSKEGFPLKVQVAQSSGSDALDNAAAEAVKKWRFVPASRGNNAIDEWVQVPIAFHLK